MEHAMRVMSWNIRSGFGSFDVPEAKRGESMLPGVSETIADTGVDIVGLQEVDRFWDRSGGVDQPRWLGEQLGMEWRYAANMIPSGGAPEDGSPQYGIALLSRWPILEHEHVLLPTPEGWEQRGALLAVIELPNGMRMSVVNTHLQVDGARGSAADQRAAGAEGIIDLVRSRALPAIVMGDLNAEPGRDELRCLTNAQSGFQDCWAVANPGEAGLTIPASPMSRPEARIDYIFATRELAVRSCEVVTNDSTRIASDHYPVVADVE
jgi:endonuclease/exonuclease/phosphatase family metal-dependent hydrolase